MDRGSQSTHWIGRVFVLSGQMMYVGPVAPTKRHAHHAFQLLLAVGHPLSLADAEGSEVVCAAAAIAPNVVHTVTRPAPACVMLYIDPETQAGRRLGRSVMSGAAASSWVTAASALDNFRVEAPSDWQQAAMLCSELLNLLVGPSVRPRPVHPAVLKAIDFIGQSLPADVALPTIAAKSGLSHDRLSHVFSSAVGIPMRRYVLWRRLMLAAESTQRGESLTAAAHAAGFADSAHMNHVFHRMFGLAPSDLHGFIQWVLPPLSEAR